MLTYATRRAESIFKAHSILKRAAGLHPSDATVQISSACFNSQMSDLAQAKVNLEQATRLDPKCRLMALEDVDLEPLWGLLAAD